MYNLKAAKDEIDAVAKHVTALADHVIVKTHDFDAQMASFKSEIIKTIEAKFADLEKAILGGDGQSLETSAVADLGAKVAQLTPAPPEPAPYVEHGHDQHEHHDQQHDHHDDHQHDQGHSNEGWHQNDHH